MQDTATRDLVKQIKKLGYEEQRCQGSHTIFRKVIIDTITIPTSDKTVQAPIARKLSKHVDEVSDFGDKIKLFR